MSSRAGQWSLPHMLLRWDCAEWAGPCSTPEHKLRSKQLPWGSWETCHPTLPLENQYMQWARWERRMAMKPALFVQDIQNIWLYDPDSNQELRRSVERRLGVINDAISWFRRNKLPIIVGYTEDKGLGLLPGTRQFEVPGHGHDQGDGSQGHEAPRERLRQP